jgi:hypothetical protein
MSDFIRAYCLRSLCFHTHSGFERNNFIFLSSSLPSRTFPKAIDKAPHPAQAGVLHALQVCGLLIRLWSHQRGQVFRRPDPLGFMRNLPSSHLGGWSLKPDTYINYLYFHQHRGETAVTRFLSSTSWRGEKLTFFLYLLSLTYRWSASLFNPPFFP